MRARTILLPLMVPLFAVLGGVLYAHTSGIVVPHSYAGETITSTTRGVTLSGSCIVNTTCPADPSSSDLFSLSPDGTTLTFTPYTASTSSFSTGDQEVTATSTGSIQLTDPTWMVNATGGSDLAKLAYVCATSTGIGTDVTNTVLYNGPLSDFTSMSYSLPGDVLSTTGPTTTTSGSTDNIVVDVYAGSEPTMCGTNTAPGTTAMGGTSNAPALSSTVVSENENIAVTVKLT